MAQENKRSFALLGDVQVNAVGLDQPLGWFAARSYSLASRQLPACAGKVSFSSATNSANVFGLRPPSF